MNYNKTALTIFILIAIITAISILPLTQAADWQPVATFNGSADQTTNTFTITEDEWRIKWTYFPSSDYPQYAVFGFFVYPQGETAMYVDSVSASGNSQTNSIEYIHEGKGTYYIKILSANIPTYIVTVEQDLVSTNTETPNLQNTSTGNPILGAVELLVIILIVIAILVLLMRRKKSHVPVIQSQTMPPPTPTNLSQNNLGGDISGRLEKLKGLLDSNLISKEEYENRKKEILSQV